MTFTPVDVTINQPLAALPEGAWRVAGIELSNNAELLLHRIQAGGEDALLRDPPMKLSPGSTTLHPDVLLPATLPITVAGDATGIVRVRILLIAEDDPAVAPWAAMLDQARSRRLP